MNNKVVILAGKSTFHSPVYRSWTDGLSLPCEYVREFDVDWTPPNDTGLVVTHRHYDAIDSSLIRRLVADDIPVLILCDGILEYRNTWEHPGVAPGALFQPVLGHKIAVIGRSQARVLDSWGNLGKCECVGLPRLDALQGRARQERNDAAFRILVATARTPAFNQQQMASIRGSLADLGQWIERTGTLCGRRIEVVWRLSGSLHEMLGVEDTLTDLSGRQIAEVLGTVDALITTPSTTMLEGMLCGIPTALLDYTNSPLYVPAAWVLSSAAHFDQLIPELSRPPAPKMLFQEMILHDALECAAPAAPRLVHLVEQMIEIAAQCRARSEPLSFPAHILPAPPYGDQLPAHIFDMKTLYPDHPVFANLDRVALQVENEKLRLRIQLLVDEIQAMQERRHEVLRKGLIRGLLEHFRQRRNQSKS